MLFLPLEILCMLLCGRVDLKVLSPLHPLARRANSAGFPLIKSSPGGESFRKNDEFTESPWKHPRVPEEISICHTFKKSIRLVRVYVHWAAISAKKASLTISAASPSRKKSPACSLGKTLGCMYPHLGGRHRHESN